MAYGLPNARYGLAALLLWALPLLGQLEVGDSTSMTMNGTASVGYTGAYAEPGTSSHGVSLGGDGYLNGYYYDPKFMSFAAHPYYNRSQNNSTFQSISDSTGVNFSTNFFTGSRFPGFFSFNKAYDSSGTFGMPGASGLTTHGNAQGFSLGWSELLPDMPSLSASYSQGNGSSTLYGSDAKSESSDRVFDLHSDYLLVGFRLRGFFQHQNTDATFPGFLVGSALNKSDSSSNSYGFSADHKMPLNGDVYGGWHRSSFNYDYVTGQTNATTDSTNLNVTMLPVRKLSLTMGVNHISNLSGALVQEVVSAGGAPPQLLPNFTSASTQYNGSAGYTILPGLYVQGQVTHWQQTLGTKDYANTLFGGTVNYNMVRNFLGNFTFILGVMDNSNQDGHLGTTLISNVNFSRIIRGWDLGSHFSYSQNLQTLIAVYTTSSYGYGATARRRLANRTYWSGSFSGMHSGLNQYAGFSSRSESFSSSFTHRGYGVSGSYSQSDGTSLFSPTGLVATPVPAAIIAPNSLVLYNAKGWSVGGSGSPMRKLQLSGTFSRSMSDTLSPGTSAHILSDMINMQARYPIRKLYFTAGYTRFKQDIGLAGATPTNVTTYYFGLSRWFNFF